MASYTDLANLAVGTGGLPSGTTVTALRDNPVAIAEGAVGAPKVESEGLGMFSGQGASAAYIDLDRVDKVLIIFNTTIARSYSLSTDNGATFGGNISASGDVIVSLGTTYNAIRVNVSHVIIGISGVKP